MKIATLPHCVPYTIRVCAPVCVRMFMDALFADAADAFVAAVHFHFIGTTVAFSVALWLTVKPLESRKLN